MARFNEQQTPSGDYLADVYVNGTLVTASTNIRFNAVKEGRYTGAEDSYITSCASAGIAIAVAAAITHGDRARVALMPDSTG
ncbi:hypothetical protein MJM28_28780, partial [Salmonella enterica subsp. enterica serovar Montevideo]|nr:hypothetical protein [Salmonella enterica subsp. enterica serovar Montevideo]